MSPVNAHASRTPPSLMFAQRGQERGVRQLLGSRTRRKARDIPPALARAALYTPERAPQNRVQLAGGVDNVLESGHIMYRSLALHADL